MAQTGRLRPDPVRLYNPAEAMPRNVASPSPGAARRHVRFGWWSLFVFASLGLTLEVLHGFKVAAYLDVTPLAANSCASAIVKPCMPALAAE